MNKPQITIKDIARALNVSPSTVSRALKNNPDISQETRDLIHAYAHEHNYTAMPREAMPRMESSRACASCSVSTAVGIPPYGMMGLYLRRRTLVRRGKILVVL